MSRINKALNGSRRYLLCVLIGTLYFVVMLKFYLINYYVPDFRAYESFYEAGYPAKDGFSSLFIWIAQFAATHPRRLNIFCLLLLTFAFINILFGVCIMLNNSIAKWILGFLFTIVSGSWYYFYGKIFYDFPFSVFSYSIGFVMTIDLLKRLEAKNNNNKVIYTEWYFLLWILGFMMSWKPYNIFMLIGLFMLAINTRSGYEFILCGGGRLKRIRNIILTAVCFIAGYFSGNFGVFYKPKETLEGIRAYKASSDFISFLFKGLYHIWDHVNSVSFDRGIISVISILSVMIIIPLILKKWKFLCISLFMFFAYSLYIYELSPGYLWHGLPIGIFAISYTVFLLNDIDNKDIQSKTAIAFYVIFAVSIFYQGFNCFGKYIPQQIMWHNKTEEAEQVLEDNYSDISESVAKYYSELTKAGYSVTYDNAVKRYRPCIYNNGVKFVDPLEFMTIMHTPEKAWITDIRELPNTDYVIYVVPNAMLEIDDIACSRKYDQDNVIDSVQGKEYEIRVIQSSYKAS